MPAVSLDGVTLSRLRAVFGDCVPQHNADAQLLASPHAPASVAELQALRAAAREAAGQNLAAFARTQSASAGRSQPAERASSQALHLNQLRATKELTTDDGLRKVLTEAQVQRAFEAARDDPDIPWSFLEEGCMWRAHVLARKLEQQGVFTEKVITIPFGGDLVMKAARARLGFTVCWSHEAVVVHMQTPTGIERRVLDPSLADRPLTADEWLALMSSTEGAALETFFLPRFACGLSSRNAPPIAWVPRDLECAFAWKDQWREALAGLEEFGFYEKLKALAGGLH